eukprot:GHVH01011199.1.p1 GENE.GHVH01011199.1~~GHVH01011199.1.p1  ORF type:complete len:601 (+),score=62.22 GHVH01011199.1:360-2162(+)
MNSVVKSVTPKGVPPGYPFDKLGNINKMWSIEKFNEYMSSFIGAGTPLSQRHVSSSPISTPDKTIKTVKGIPPGPPFDKTGAVLKEWSWRGWPALGGSLPAAKSKTAKGVAPKGPPPPRKATAATIDPRSSPGLHAVTGPKADSSGTKKGQPPGPPPRPKHGLSVSKVTISPPPGKGGCGDSGTSLKPAHGKSGMTKKSVKVKASPALKVCTAPSPPAGWVAKTIQWSTIAEKRIKTGAVWSIISQPVVSQPKPKNIFEELKMKQVAMKLRAEGHPPPVACKRFEWNYKEVTSLFFQDPETIRLREEERTRKELEKREGQNGKAVKHLLDPQKSMNLEIGLKGLGLLSDIQPLWRMVRDLQFDSTCDAPVINTEVLGVLMSLFPVGEDLEALEKHMKLPKSERPAEKFPIGEEFILQCLNIPNFILRAKSCLVKLGFKEKMARVAEKTRILHKCTKNLASAFEVPHGIMLILFKALLDFGNFINYGTRRGSAKGITLKSLEAFRSIKSTSNSTTAFRYLINQLTDQLGENFNDKLETTLSLTVPSSNIGDFKEIMASIDQLGELVRRVRWVENRCWSYNSCFRCARIWRCLYYKMRISLS